MADKTVASLSSSTPTVDDLTISYDNADTSELKKTTWQAVRDLFKTYFDTIYASLSGGTFTGDISVPDEAYWVGWNGSMEVPTKNALYDKIETISGGGSSTFIGLTDTPSSYSGQTGKFPKVNAGETGLEFVTITGGWDALTTNPLSQFASTTSSQLAGVISDETGSGSLVFSNSPTLTTPVLGTPSSGTLTNCTGLPVAGITGSTSTALGVWSIELWHATDTSITRVSAWVVAIEWNNIVTNTSSPTLWTITTTGNIELGNASDTTISRVSAGVIAVEWVTVPTISSTNTLTNKRITKRVETVSSSATPASNTDSYDITKITSLATNITSLTSWLTGTPVDWDLHMWSFTDNWTPRSITPWSSFENSTVSFPSTTVISTRLDVLCEWNSATSKWRVIATA